jgi:outer membrane immunogenic protein
MNRILISALSVLSLAAIAATSANAAAPAPYSWTGCYLGGNVGYGLSNEQWNYGYYAGVDYNLDYGHHQSGGALGGAQFGCNYQMGMWVVGLEGEFDFTNMTGNHVFGSYYQSTNMNWIATATGRLGYVVGPSLFYVKGGAAWDRGSYDMMLSGIGYTDTITRSGWVVGGGVEYAYSGNWSIKLEYTYMQFPYKDVWWNYLYASPPDPWSFHINQGISAVKIGFNWRY